MAKKKRKPQRKARIGCRPGCARITVREQCDAHRPDVAAQLLARLMRKSFA
jgi:hypothetical protein